MKLNRILAILFLLLIVSAVVASTRITDESSNIITDENGSVILWPPYPANSADVVPGVTTIVE